MLIYRYEKEDGGGPYCTRDGYLRNDLRNIGKLDDNYLSGCLSIFELKEYWKKQENFQFYLQNCQIKCYDISESEIKYTKNHVLFPKNHSPIN